MTDLLRNLPLILLAWTAASFIFAAGYVFGRHVNFGDPDDG